MKLFFVSILVFIFFSNAYSQQLYICSGYTEEGEPIDASIQLTITPHQNNNYYILFDNILPFNRDEVLFIFFDKIDKSGKSPFDSKVINVERGKTWAVFNYSFKESGKYEIYLIDSSNKRLATTRITVWETLKTDFESMFARSFYYANTEVAFCQTVFLGKPVNPFTSWSLSKNGNDFCVFLKCSKSFNTNIFTVQVWKRKNSPVEYDQYLATKKYLITKGWDYAFFNYKIYRPGDYKFIIFNEKEILIKSAYITITE